MASMASQKLSPVDAAVGTGVLVDLLGDVIVKALASPVLKEALSARRFPGGSSSIESVPAVLGRTLAVFAVEVIRMMNCPASSMAQAPAAQDENLDREGGDELASAPEWVREAHERARAVARPIYTDPADRRARLIRDRLVIALRRREMTQSALADSIGKSASQVSRILKNPERTQLDTLAQIADVLGIDLSDILRSLGPDEPSR